MKALSIALLVALLPMLGGCGEKAADNKAEAAAPAVAAKELSPEEKFAETKQKAESGEAEAQYKLGVMYHKGEGIPHDVVRAAQWYQKAAAQRFADAETELGEMYCWGTGVPKDAMKAIELLQRASVQGNALAQFRLGKMYHFDADKLVRAVKAKAGCVKPDVAKSDEWFHKAAESFNKAAEQGDTRAQYYLGQMYRDGYGVSVDTVKAVEWFQKAAEKGNSNAQNSLGSMYQKGSGVPKDVSKAIEWYQKSAAQGNSYAQLFLGSIYENGDGVPKDDRKAFEWTQKAASQGNSTAQFVLGRKFETGDGTNVSLVTAYAWYNLAAASFDMEYFSEARNRVEARLSPAQRAEGQRLASNWKKGDTLQASSDSPSGPASPDGKPSKQGTGTAFAVSNAGHALTNQHVVNGCAEVKVAGREGIAKVITSDGVNDLALLQLPGSTREIAYLNPDPGKLRQGEDIIVFGYPLEWALSSGGNLTPGIISALTGLGNNTNQIQITAPIQPGSSGSPVMDKKGNVVGMVSMKLSDAKMVKATGSVGQNVNFAVNGQTIKAFLDANKVPYKTGGGLFSREKSNADIAEEASKWTVLVECWK